MKLIMLIFCLLMCGCTGQEPEARDYALGMFVEADNNVTLGTAKLTKAKDKVRESVFYSGKGDTIAQAIREIDTNTGGSVYMGHLVMCAIDKQAINRDNLKSLISLFNSDEDLSKGVIVVCTDDMQALKDAKWGGGDIISYVRQYYKKSSTYTGQSYPLDINRLTHILTETDGDVAIPVIHCDKQDIKIQGGAVVRDYKYVGDMEKAPFGYMLWILPDKNGSATINVDGAVVQLNQQGIEKNIKDEKLVYKIKAQGRLLQGNTGFGKQNAEDALKQEITSLVQSLQVQFKSDCLEAAEYYNRMTGQQKSFENIPIEIETDIEWKGI